MRCHFCFCFFNWYFYRNYEFCSRMGIKKHKPIIKKKKEKHHKTIFSAKSKLNSIEILISKALIDLNVSHDEFVLINNVLKKIYDITEEIKNSNVK